MNAGTRPTMLSWCSRRHLCVLQHLLCNVPLTEWTGFAVPRSHGGGALRLHGLDVRRFSAFFDINFLFVFNISLMTSTANSALRH